MIIHVSKGVAGALSARASEQNVTPKELVHRILSEHLAQRAPFDLTPRDEWERLLMGIGLDCGVSLTDVSRETIYE
jgi:hypothetical protein